MLKQPINTNRYINSVLISALLLFTLLFIINTSRQTSIFGIDLRNRIVGARLLAEGEDSYYYKLGSKTPERYLDPLDIKQTSVNRVTVTPAYLILLKPLSNLPYNQIRFFWFYFQYFCLLAIGGIFIYLSQSVIQKKYIAIITLAVIGCSGPWTTHLYVAQNYILYPFFLSIIYLLHQIKNKYCLLLAGILLGITCFIRPPFILLLLPFIIYNNKKIIFATIIGLLIGIGIFYVNGHQKAWKNYSNAMNTYGTFQLNTIQNNPKTLATVIEKSPFHEHIIDLNESLSNNHNLSLQRLAYDFLSIKLNKTSLTAVLVLIISVVLLFLYRSNNRYNDNQLFIIGSLLVLVSEYLIPAPRLSYNYVQWIFPLCLLALEYNFLTLKKSIQVLILGGIILNLHFLGNFMVFKTSLGEVMLLTAFVALLLTNKKITSTNPL